MIAYLKTVWVLALESLLYPMHTSYIDPEKRKLVARTKGEVCTYWNEEYPR